jgi:hypothetical protein
VVVVVVVLDDDEEDEEDEEEDEEDEAAAIRLACEGAIGAGRANPSLGAPNSLSATDARTAR